MQPTSWGILVSTQNAFPIRRITIVMLREYHTGQEAHVPNQYRN